MPSHTILPDPQKLKLICLTTDAQRITLTASTISSEAACPLCNKSSGRVHSRYVRTLSDLPWQGICVRVRLRVRRFFCDEPSCERAIFAERLPGVVAHYARRTRAGWMGCSPTSLSPSEVRPERGFFTNSA
jgi:transposase